VSPLHPTGSELADEFGIYAFNAPPTLLDALPLDVVQLNNNHSLDLGDAGLEATVAEVAARGLLGIGVDDNALLVPVDDLQIGLLSYTWGLNADEPTAHDLHVVPFGRPGPVDLEPVAADIAAARADGATHVVLLLHWGYEYEYWPDPRWLQLGRELVALGADVVVGSGPHVVEPAELCDVNRPLAVPGIGRCSVRDPDGRSRTAAILYSLGDFGTALPTLPLQVGIVGSVSLRRDVGVTGLGWEAVASTPGSGRGEVLVPLEELRDDPEVDAEALRLDALLGTSWKVAR
jgi:poly-gamma-glutamate synthesis protein (capsule biosynthesis protein)